MLKRERETLLDIAMELSAISAIRKIIAYGSRVRGDFRGESDLDVLVLVREKTKEIKKTVIDAFYDRELTSGISFSISIMPEREFETGASAGSPFIKEIKEEGVVIYDAQSGREKSPVGIQAR